MGQQHAAVEYGAHLPLIEFEDAPPTLADLGSYAAEAARLGFRCLCANDHLLFGRPWLDGPSALAATIGAAGDMAIATTVALPVVRGPIQTAKMLAALDLLSEGRLVAGVGPGSSARDYTAVGLPFEERWPRFEESIRALRALLGRGREVHRGRFYSTEGLLLEPRPAQPGGPPIWVASWGSDAGLRRVARLGDGWLASGYNTTPERFRASASFLAEQLHAAGRDDEGLPNAIATLWLYVTDSRRDEDRIVTQLLAPLLGRTPEAIRALSLPIGPPDLCAERIEAFARAGAQRLFVWPVTDELRQLTRFRAEVVPLVSPASTSA